MRKAGTFAPPRVSRRVTGTLVAFFLGVTPWGEAGCVLDPHCWVPCLALSSPQTCFCSLEGKWSWMSLSRGHPTCHSVFLGKQLPRGAGGSHRRSGPHAPTLEIPAFVQERECVEGAIPAPASCPAQRGCLRVRLSCFTIESFHFLSPWPVPGPGPQVGGRKFFPPPHTPRHTPLAAVQPPFAGRPAVLFHAFSTKRLCFFTLGTSLPRGWAGGCLEAHWLRQSGPFFPTLFGGPLCVSSL